MKLTGTEHFINIFQAPTRAEQEHSQVHLAAKPGRALVWLAWRAASVTRLLRQSRKHMQKRALHDMRASMRQLAIARAIACSGNRQLVATGAELFVSGDESSYRVDAINVDIRPKCVSDRYFHNVRA